MRPLISTGDPKKSVDISRKAELYETSSGMLTITGGKLTTWRRMAEQVVDRIVEREGRERRVPDRRHPARHAGASGGPGDANSSCPKGAAEQLAFRYGHAARTVLDLCEERPRARPADRAGAPDLMAEVVIAARAEQARSVADVLLRRTRLGLLAAPELRDGKVAKKIARAAGRGARLGRRAAVRPRRAGARSLTARVSTPAGAG